MDTTIAISKTCTPHLASHRCESADELIVFRQLTPEALKHVWHYLLLDRGRTCDFSYGGLLIWAPLFNYEYAVYKDTLFIKGKLEGDMSKVAFSLPLGSLPLEKSIELLLDWCVAHNEKLRFSAIPEYALQDFSYFQGVSIQPQEDWADYLYEIEPLATLSGKKMAKKRNHVNKFETTYPGYRFCPLDKQRLKDAERLMSKISSQSEDETSMAVAERELCIHTLKMMATYDLPMTGGILYVDDEPAAFTVGDIKGDTLYIHLEKADRDFIGAYEAINKYFARYMLEHFPQLKFVNREDDAGSPGLKLAKQSYHPVELLFKYDIML